MTRRELIEHLVRSARKAQTEYVTVRVADLLAALAEDPESPEPSEGPGNLQPRAAAQPRLRRTSTTHEDVSR